MVDTPKAQNYLYKTIEDFEEVVGCKVNETFKDGWVMARLTEEQVGIESPPESNGSVDICPHCKQKLPPVAAMLSIFFMSDGHYFIRLDGKTRTELKSQALAMLEREPYGLLGSVHILDQYGKGIRWHGYCAHAKSSTDVLHWENEVEKWLFSLDEDPEVRDLLSRGAVKQKTKVA